MTINERVKTTVESGIVPLSFYLEPVYFFSGAVAVMRTKLVINSLALGMLTHNEYRYVAARSKQGDDFVTRHIHKLLRVIPKLDEEWVGINCFTVPVFARLLKDGKLSEILFNAFAKFPEISPSRICVEISADILYEDMDEIRQRINELRELGVKVAMAEMGDEYCPMFRLHGVKIDYAFLDRYAVNSLSTDDKERIAGSVINYLHFLGIKVVAPELYDDEAMAALQALDCDGYTTDGFSFSEYEPKVTEAEAQIASMTDALAEVRTVSELVAEAQTEAELEELEAVLNAEAEEESKAEEITEATEEPETEEVPEAEEEPEVAEESEAAEESETEEVPEVEEVSETEEEPEIEETSEIEEEPVAEENTETEETAEINTEDESETEADAETETVEAETEVDTIFQTESEEKVAILATSEEEETDGSE